MNHSVTHSNIFKADVERHTTQLSVDVLVRGIERYLSWIREQGDVHEYFTAAEHQLRSNSLELRWKNLLQDYKINRIHMIILKIM